jgi:hypothetical protein
LDFDVPTSTYKRHIPDPFLDATMVAPRPLSYKDDDDFPF